MSVFAEPLAQARAYIRLRRITRARSEALAALDLIERQAGEMETALREIASTDFDEPSDFSELGRIARAVLSAREEAQT